MLALELLVTLCTNGDAVSGVCTQRAKRNARTEYARESHQERAPDAIMVVFFKSNHPTRREQPSESSRDGW
jgi:hypothetical protein